MFDPHDDELLRKIADEVELAEPVKAPSRLKAKLYSALLLEQAHTGPLMSTSESEARGGKLCVFEQLVRIAPVGEAAKTLNICRVCHARVLAEHFETPPIFWPGCPYAGFKKS